MRFLEIAVGLVCCTVWVPFAHAGDKKAPIFTIGPMAGGQDGMAVSSNFDAANVGASVLAQGGNAVDAAIAMEFALNVSEPPFSGIGGGGFMLVYEAATGTTTMIDSRERAPASATPGMFVDPGDVVQPLATRKTWGISVGVPGALAGAEAALERFGTWPLKKVIAPAIELADKGVIVTPLLAESIAANLSLLGNNSAAKAVFLPGGQPLEVGDLLVQPDLAKTFRLIQKHGIDVFYRGEIGKALVAEVHAMPRPGGMTIADLESYAAVVDEEPVRGLYQGYEIVSAAPPTSGGLTVLQTLAMLEHKDLGQYANDPVKRYNLVLQALQLAFADRNKYLGDPEFVDIPFDGWLDPDYIEARAARMSPDLVDCTKITAGTVPGATSAAQGPSEAAFDGETTHLTVVDRWGNVVAFTTTIEQVFGTGRMLPGYGFMINNELTDFDARPGGPNEVQPFKRPLSSIAPSIVFDDGAPILTLGSPGGPRIIGSVVQVLINIFDLGLDLQTAVALPRLFSSSCTATPNVRWDAGFPDAIRAALSAQPFNYRFEPAPQEVGNVNLIEIGGEAYTGVADSRREGVAIGLTDKAGKQGK